MTTLIEVLAGLAILTNAVVYGTDVFGAIILRPAIAAVDDRAFALLLGHVHRVADRRIAAIAITGLFSGVAMTAVAAVDGRGVSTAAGGLAVVALIAFTVVYTRVSKPVNAVLTAAAVDGVVPDDARQLQARWDAVIDGRVALQTLALVALCVALAAA